MKPWKDRLKENNQADVRSAVWGLGIFIYLSVLFYAGVRSYSLFRATIAPEYFWLAALGIVAMELSAMTLPLAVHFATAPGPHRNFTYGFYALDLLVLVLNSVLDAGHQSGTILIGFLNGYGTYVVPALPIMCLIGWSLWIALSPEAKRHDAERAIQASLRESLLDKIEQQMQHVDVTAQVQAAAQIQARQLLDTALWAGSQRPTESAQTPLSYDAARILTGERPLSSFAADVPEPPQIEVTAAKN